MQHGQRRHPCLFLVVAALLLLARSEAFQDGDYVPVSRRGQFSQVRSNWHDLLGRYCPRFGSNRLVAVPIPHPITGSEVGSYKIMLALAGDRLYTHWLRILGPGAPEVPFLEVTLIRTGNDVISVRAEVGPVPDTYVHMHQQLKSEWVNATAWPKHLLVEYKWVERHEVNAIPGLYVLISSCLIVALVLVVSALLSNEAKVREFMADMAAEEPVQQGLGAGFDAPYRGSAAPKGD